MRYVHAVTLLTGDSEKMHTQAGEESTEYSTTKPDEAKQTERKKIGDEYRQQPFPRKQTETKCFFVVLCAVVEEEGTHTDSNAMN